MLPQIFYNRNSTDNCTASNNLVLFIGSDENDPNPYQDIINYPAGISGQVFPMLTVRDEAGNESNCIVPITITQIGDPCLNDSIPPNITCQGDIILPYSGLDYVAVPQAVFESANDNCTSSDSLAFFISDVLHSGPPPTTDVIVIPEGTQGFTPATVWAVDEAGNYNSCSTQILVQGSPTQCANDSIDPVAQCIGFQEIVVDFTPNVIIEASMFNNGSFDNCTNPVDLEFFISSDLGGTTLPTTTALIYPTPGPAMLDTVAIWVVDEAGNTDVCISTFILSAVSCSNMGPISVDCVDQLILSNSPSGYTIEPTMLLEGLTACDLIYNEYELGEFLNGLVDTLFYPAGTTGSINVGVVGTDSTGQTSTCPTIVYFMSDSLSCLNDSIAPVVICTNEINLDLDPNSDYTLLATSLDDGSFDYCSEQTSLEYFISFDSSLTSPPLTTELIIPAGTNGSLTAFLWVVDEAGNYSVCNLQVNISSLLYINVTVFNDLNANCVQDSGELGLENYSVAFSRAIGGLNSVLQTDAQGNAWVATSRHFPDQVTVELLAPNGSSNSCVTSYTFELLDVPTPYDLSFPISLSTDCDDMTVDIGTSILRRCFPSTYTVGYCNNSIYDIDSVEIIVTLPASMVVQTTGLPFTNLGNNQFLFEIGNVASNYCSSFPITVILDCNTPLGATKCVQAEITPNTCQDPMQQYNGADLTVSAACDVDVENVRFTIINQGSSDMPQALDYIVIEDVIMYMQNPLQLDSGDSTEVVVPANGSTWRIEIPQPDGHPSLSTVSTAIEGCIEYGSSGLINQFSQADADPFLSIECNEVVGSWDPNDKQAFPVGVGEDHFINQNASIEYKIRFQNTGTDTAFTVRIEDQLDEHLDFTSIQAGASSHSYRMELQTNGKLIFHFENINLPDSTANEPGSHGFVNFRVNQLIDNTIGTMILNTADIYFDFNEAIVTNTVNHTVGDNFIINGISNRNNKIYSVQVAPNPAHQFASIKIEHVEYMDASIELYNVYGQLLHTGQMNDNQYRLDRKDLPAGSYFFSIRNKNQILGNGKLILK